MSGREGRGNDKLQVGQNAFMNLDEIMLQQRSNATPSNKPKQVGHIIVTPRG